MLVVCCLLFGVRWVLFVDCCSMVHVRCLCFAVGWSLFGVRCFVRCWLSAGLLYVVCCVLFFGCCLWCVL